MSDSNEIASYFFSLSSHSFFLSLFSSPFLSLSVFLHTVDSTRVRLKTRNGMDSDYINASKIDVSFDRPVLIRDLINSIALQHPFYDDNAACCTLVKNLLVYA